MAIPRAWRSEIEAIAADARSGASALGDRAAALIERVLTEDPASLPAVARAVVRTQPAMASMWHVAAAALGARQRPENLVSARQRWRRGREALIRHALATLAPPSGGALRVATWSCSGTVLACLRRLATTCRLAVACAEGRPALEGRDLAASLAAVGARVEFSTDAALDIGLDGSTRRPDAVVVGADAVSPAWVINKSGTGILAAAASGAGIPVYVLAARDKYVDERMAAVIRLVEGDPDQIWPSAPDGVDVRNICFERVPTAVITAVIGDAGVLAGPMIGEACRAAWRQVPEEVVATLLADTDGR